MKIGVKYVGLCYPRHIDHVHRNLSMGFFICHYLICGIVDIFPTPSYSSSLYLSHQFSFRILGEDFHALICRFHPDIGGCKIDVRREVKVNAYSGWYGRIICGRFSPPTTCLQVFVFLRRTPLYACLDYYQPYRIVIPMLHNGISRSQPK